MGVSFTLAYFVVTDCTVSKQNELMLYGESFLFILRMDGLNIVSNEK